MSKFAPLLAILALGTTGYLRAEPADPRVISPDGKLELVTDFSALELRDVGTGKKVRRLEQDLIRSARILAMAFSPDGHVIASLHQTDWSRREVFLWLTATGKFVRRIEHDELQFHDRLIFSPDGLLLASWSEGPTITPRAVFLWDPITGHRLRALRVAPEVGPSIEAAAFAPGGGRFVVWRDDGVIRSWDLRNPQNDGALKGGPPSATELRARWDDLADEDTRHAFRAMALLTYWPKEGTMFLRAQLKPVPEGPPSQVTRLLTDLNADHPERRLAAHEELLRLGGLAEPKLREALTRRPSLDLRTRIEDILTTLEKRPLVLPSEDLRALRALRVLEQIDNPESRQLLKELADGAPWAFVTQRARAALDRMEKDGAAK